MPPPRPQPPPGREHGSHTLRVHAGTVVGIHGDDVFVELGPRMQGVISRRKFEREPQVGDVHEFTLRGQEDSLWALALREERSLVSWEEMEPGSLVNARVVRKRDEGLQLMVGPLHAFMPRSHTGLARGQDPGLLVGKTLSCEVLEVDPEKQRVLLSHKLVLQRERESERQRLIGALKPGAVVQGRVARIEPYGVFLRFGRGLQGLIHVSNLSHERVEHPAEVVELGQALEARVLYLRERGKRIGLGLKQMGESPWRAFAAGHEPGDLVHGHVSRVAPFGAFVTIVPGVEGLVHRSQMGIPHDRRPAERAPLGRPLSLRILALDPERERMSLSLLHSDGAPIHPDEALDRVRLAELDAEEVPGGLKTPLGELLRRALRERDAG